jgi:hypothetical protein
VGQVWGILKSKYLIFIVKNNLGFSAPSKNQIIQELKKPNKNSVLLGFKGKNLVETAGIEPASASTVP